MGGRLTYEKPVMKKEELIKNMKGIETSGQLIECHERQVI